MCTIPILSRLTRLAGLALLCSVPGHALQAQVAQPAFVEIMATPALLSDLRRGGYVLYMRHGTTDNSRADRAPTVDLNDCNTQRVLNDEGRKLAQGVGRNIVQAKIPVGDVFHSPLCRARESAELAFPALRGKLQPELNLAYTANLTAEEKKPVLAATRKLLSAPVAAGSNRVLVAHAPNMADLMGYFVKPEGTVVVIRPLGNDQFEYIASVPPTLWAHLLK
jgi:phosphohistidine phosphatase SixA